MSRLRRQIIAILEKDGWTTDASKIHPATGFWRTSPYVDVYRWQAWIKKIDSPYDDHCSVGCWETMTDFVQLAKNNGFTIETFHGCSDIHANPNPT